MFIEPELLHLNDEIRVLYEELNISSLYNDVQSVVENFHRIANDVREKFNT